MVPCCCAPSLKSISKRDEPEKSLDSLFPEIPERGSLDFLLEKLKESLKGIEILTNRTQTIGYRLTPKSYQNLCAALPGDKSMTLYQKAKERFQVGDLVVMDARISDQSIIDEQSQTNYKVTFDLYRQPRAA